MAWKNIHTLEWFYRTWGDVKGDADGAWCLTAAFMDCSGVAV